jgi:hypothetical protein
MNGSRSPGRILLVLPLLFVFACAVFTVADAQGLPESLSPATPPNDCGCPRGDNAIPVSSGMLTPFLPKIPNLELGFLYSFGKNVRTGRFTADYLLPFRLSADSVLFGEAHAEGWDFWKRPSVSITTPPDFTTTTSTTNSRVDLSFGGGYRTMLGGTTFLGANGFYDASRVFNKWYSSGGVGLEMAATVGGGDAVDVNFNWYGNLFNRDVLVNAFRNKGNSFDVEAGYSHALFDHAMDLRLKLVGYQFDIGTAVQGWRGGADLTTKNGMFTFRYEHGYDRLNGDYNTVGGFITVGLQLENLLSFESPFIAPEPVFKSPRDLRRLLGLKVKRNWHQPTSVVVARLSQESRGQGTTPFFLFELWDKTVCLHDTDQFDQPQQVRVDALTYPGPNGATASSYAVIIVDPNHTLPPTISVTLTAAGNVGVNPGFIPATLTDGTPNIVVGCSLKASNYGFGSGTITITDTTTGTVTPLVVTVTPDL